MCWGRGKRILPGKGKSLTLCTMYVALRNPPGLFSTHTSSLLATALQFLTIFLFHSFILIVKLQELCTINIFYGPTDHFIALLAHWINYYLLLLNTCRIISRNQPGCKNHLVILPLTPCSALSITWGLQLHHTTAPVPPMQIFIKRIMNNEQD